MVYSLILLIFYLGFVFEFCFPAHQSNNHCRRGKSSSSSLFFFFFFFFLGLFIFTSSYLHIVTLFKDFGGMVISDYLLRVELFFSFFLGRGELL
jgi:hypothetical protein